MKSQTISFSRPAAQRQRGASLFIILILLSTVGLMTLTAFYMGRNQYRLVANIQYEEQAFNQAEAVVAQAEDWLNSGNNAKSTDFTTYNGGGGVYPIGQLAALGFNVKTMTWSSTNSIASGDGRYLVAQLAKDLALSGNSLQLGQAATTCKAVNVFQVVGRSNPVRGASRTIETTYATPAC